MENIEEEASNNLLQNHKGFGDNIGGNKYIFNSTPNINLDDLLNKLKRGAQKYYKILRGDKGPYQYLNINEEIFAGVNKNQFMLSDSISTTVQNEEGAEFSFVSEFDKLWSKGFSHIILLGDGGMGKTVTLIHLWESILNSKNENLIPIFLSLNEYNTAIESERVNFVLRQICKHYLGTKISQENEINALWSLLEGNLNKLQYIFLLDGFNEITVDDDQRKHLLIELQEIQLKAKSVSIVVTSRIDMNFTWARGYEVLKLLPISENKVRNFLQNNNIDFPQNATLKVILQNPMMLTLYASSNEIFNVNKENTFFDFRLEIQTQGELIWNFLEGQIVKLSILHLDSNPDLFYKYKFYIRHFLPYIGYIMQKDGLFVTNLTRLKEIIIEACTYFYSENFIQTFPEYLRCLASFNLNQGDQFKNIRNINEIIKICVQELCLIKLETRNYEFLHQNFRDFFAASHVVNDLTITNYNNQFSEILGDRVLPKYIREYVSSITGEFRDNKNKKTILKEALDNLRHIFDPQKLGYSVVNIISIWKDCNNDLSQYDFSNLNLTGTNLHDALCYRKKNKTTYESTNFNNSIVNINSFIQKGHTDNIICLAFHPDGNTFISGSMDKTIKKWDANSGLCMNDIKGHQGGINCVAFHPSGETFLSGSEDKSIILWHYISGLKKKEFIGHENSIKAISFHPDGKTFISISADKTIRYWDIDSQKCIQIFKLKYDTINTIHCITFHPDGLQFVAGVNSGFIYFWDLKKEFEIRRIRINTDRIEGLVFTSERDALLSYSDRGTLNRYDLNKNINQILNDEYYHHTDGAFDHEAKTIITGSSTGKIRLRDTKTGLMIDSFFAHKGTINSIAFHPRGNTFITGSSDYSIKLWDTLTRLKLLTFEGSSNKVTCIKHLPNGRAFLTGSSDKTVRLWDSESGICIENFIGHTDTVNCLALSSNNKILASGSEDATIKLWDINNGHCIMTLTEHMDSILCITFHIDNNILISGSRDKSLKIWDLQTGQCIKTSNEHFSPVTAVEFVPNDLDKFFSGYEDGVIKHWDLKKKLCINTISFYHNKIIRIGFNNKSNILAPITNGNEIYLWDIKTGKIVVNLDENSEETIGIGVDPKLNVIFALYNGNSIKFWNLDTFKLINVIRIQKEIYNSVGLFLNENKMVSVQNNNLIKIWNLPSEILPSQEFTEPRANSKSFFRQLMRLTLKNSKQINYTSGQFLVGCTFFNLHNESVLSINDKNMLISKGALFNNL